MNIAIQRTCWILLPFVAVNVLASTAYSIFIFLIIIHSSLVTGLRIESPALTTFLFLLPVVFLAPFLFLRRLLRQGKYEWAILIEIILVLQVLFVLVVIYTVLTWTGNFL